MPHSYVPYGDSSVKVLSPTPTAGTPARQVDDNFSVLVDMVGLSYSRAPTAHKTSHATGGSDALAAADIGAAASGHNHTGTYQPAGTYAGSPLVAHLNTNSYAIITSAVGIATANDVVLSAGNASLSNGGVAGSVRLDAGRGYQSGDIVLTPQPGVEYGGFLILNNIPTSDPSYPGAVWRDGATLKISLGD